MSVIAFQKAVLWGEEDVKLFIFPRSDYPNSSLVLDVERKLLELRFSGTKVALSWVVVVVVFRRNSN